VIAGTGLGSRRVARSADSGLTWTTYNLDTVVSFFYVRRNGIKFFNGFWYFFGDSYSNGIIRTSDFSTFTRTDYPTNMVSSSDDFSAVVFNNELYISYRKDHDNTSVIMKQSGDMVWSQVFEFVYSSSFPNTMTISFFSFKNQLYLNAGKITYKSDTAGSNFQNITEPGVNILAGSGCILLGSNGLSEPMKISNNGWNSTALQPLYPPRGVNFLYGASGDYFFTAITNSFFITKVLTAPKTGGKWVSVLGPSFWQNDTPNLTYLGSQGQYSKNTVMPGDGLISMPNSILTQATKLRIGYYITGFSSVVQIVLQNLENQQEISFPERYSGASISSPWVDEIDLNWPIQDGNTFIHFNPNDSSLSSIQIFNIEIYIP
jgi:hypothetical protein